MTIRGRYEEDENFITVYADNRIYTIAKNSGNWSSVGTGERAYIGGVLTQKRFNELASACSKEGVFKLSDA